VNGASGVLAGVNSTGDRNPLEILTYVLLHLMGSVQFTDQSKDEKTVLEWLL
jgi:hypothetical protein